MSEKELLNQKLGDYAEAEVSLVDTAIVFSVKMPLGPLVEKAVDPLVDKLKALIPGDWGDATLEKVKAAIHESFGLPAPVAAPAAAAAAPSQVAPQ